MINTSSNGKIQKKPRTLMLEIEVRENLQYKQESSRRDTANISTFFLYCVMKFPDFDQSKR